MRSTAVASEPLSCPSVDALQAFLEGSARADASDAIKAHLLDCDACRQLVLGLGSAPQAERITQDVAQPEAAAPPSLEPGRAVGRYRVLGRLGAGGMGVVYAAHDPELGRKVALKLMRRDTAGDASAAALQARLLREAHAMARVSHPNVITIYDVGAWADGVFIAMELVEGETLGRWMAQPRPWREVLQLFHRAGDGLEAAHQAGLVHRDFKPDNVLVARDGRVRVTDFGLARLDGLGVDEPSAPAQPSGVLGLSLTRSGAVMGTPAYMPPEQLAGRPTDVRSDVFSFCVALFEALYGQRPFAGSTLPEMRDAIHAGPAPAPHRGVPTRVRRVLLRGLRVEPAERYATMGALLGALAAAARPPARRAVALGAGLTLALAVAGGAWTLARGRAAPVAPPPKVERVPAPAPHPPVVPAPAAVVPAPARGTLIVRTNSDRARFELDGDVVAEAAQTAQISAEAGRDHVLRVTAPGYRVYQTRVRVGADALVEKVVTLSRRGPSPRAAPGEEAPEPAAAAVTPRSAIDPDDAIDPYSSK